MMVLILVRKQNPILPLLHGPFQTEDEVIDFFEKRYARKDKLLAAYVYESRGCASCKKLTRILTLMEER